MQPSILILYSMIFFVIKLGHCTSLTNKFSTYSILEQEIHCGTQGYLIQYGKKYCLRFNSPKYKNKFDEPGKNFVDCTTDCLLKKIIQITYNEERKNPPDCNNLYAQAFESHAQCYLKCNFCTICKSNKKALFNAYDFKDFMSRAAVYQIYHVMKQCGPFACL